MLNVYKKRAQRSGLSGRKAEQEAIRRERQAELSRTANARTKFQASASRTATASRLRRSARPPGNGDAPARPASAQALSSAVIDHPVQQAVLHTVQAYAGHAGSNHVARPIFEGLGFKSISVTARHGRIDGWVTGQSVTYVPTPYTRSMMTIAYATGQLAGLVASDTPALHQTGHVNIDGTNYAGIDPEGGFDIFGAGGASTPQIYTFCGGFMRIRGSPSLGAVADYCHAGPDGYKRIGGRGSGPQNTVAGSNASLYNQAYVRYGVPTTVAELFQTNPTTNLGPEGAFEVVVPIPPTQSGWWLMSDQADGVAVANGDFARGNPADGFRSGSGYFALTVGGPAGETVRVSTEIVLHYAVSVAETHATNSFAQIPKATPPSHVIGIAGHSGSGKTAESATSRSVINSLAPLVHIPPQVKAKVLDHIVNKFSTRANTGMTGEGHSELKQSLALSAIVAAPMVAPRARSAFSNFMSTMAGAERNAARALPYVEEVAEDAAPLLLMM